MSPSAIAKTLALSALFASIALPPLVAQTENPPPTVTRRAVEVDPPAAPAIGGRIVDPSGRPLPNVRVSARPIGGKGALESDSDAEGRFSIAARHGGAFFLKASLPGYTRYDESQGAHGGVWRTRQPGEFDIEIVLRPLIMTSFLVIDAATGAPIERFGVRSVEDPRYGVYSSTDDDTIPIRSRPGGTARIFAVPDFHLYRIEAPGYAPQLGPVAFDAPDQERQTIRLSRGGGVKGRVWVDNAPGAGASVCLQGEALRASSGNAPVELNAFTGRCRSVTAGDDGAFEFVDLAEGTWVLDFRAAGAAPLDKRGVHVGAGQVVDLGFVALEAGCTIGGQVILRDGASPQGIRIVLDRAWGEVEQVTDDEGRFRFVDVAPGDHELDVADIGHRVADGEAFPVHVAPCGSAEILLDLRSRSPRPLTVRLKVNGKPGVGYRVASHHAHGGGTPGETDAAGTFEGFLRGRDTHVSVSQPGGFALVQKTVSTAAVEAVILEIDLVASDVTVLLPDGTKLDDDGYVEIELRESAPRKGSPARVYSERFLRNVFDTLEPQEWPRTRFELGLIPIGEYDVYVTGSAGRYWKELVVEAHKPVALALTAADRD